MIVSHLLQVNDSASRNNFVKCWLPIRQLALRPNFQRMRIPSDADHRSEAMAIAIPN
jgi:hypothetical protein